MNEVSLNRENDVLHSESPERSMKRDMTMKPTPTEQGSSTGIAECDGEVKFRIVTYNVLAQMLVRRDLFPYATPIALRWWHRKKLFEAEIDRLDADILCMQEVDNYGFWSKMLGNRGYNVRYHQLPMKKHGLLIAYRSRKFHEVAYEKFDYDSLVAVDDVESSELAKQSNSGQIIALELVYNSYINPSVQFTCNTETDTASNGKKEAADYKTEGIRVDEVRINPSEVTLSSVPFGICLLNTHLYWHPDYHYVRARQTIYAIKRLINYAKSVNDLVKGNWTRKATKIYEQSHLSFFGSERKKKDKPVKPKLDIDQSDVVWRWPCLMCGDFNSNPDSVLYSLLTKRNWDEQTIDKSNVFLTPRTHYSLNASKLPFKPIENEDIRQITEEEDKRRRERVLSLLSELKELPLLKSIGANYDCSCGIEAEISHLCIPSDEKGEGREKGKAEKEEKNNYNAVLEQIKKGPRWSKEPPYTHAVKHFVGTLDYIFIVDYSKGNGSRKNKEKGREKGMNIQPHLECTHLLPIPDILEIHEKVGLPSEVRPSDHVPLGADFRMTWTATTP